MSVFYKSTAEYVFDRDVDGYLLIFRLCPKCKKRPEVISRDEDDWIHFGCGCGPAVATEGIKACELLWNHLLYSIEPVKYTKQAVVAELVDAPDSKFGEPS